jgi:DNA-binding CsgD family transcriptional regulator
MEIDRIIDEIYEVVVTPEIWLRTLDRITEIAGAEGTLVSATFSDVTRTLTSRPFVLKSKEIRAPEWSGLDERTRRFMQIKEPRFLTDRDAFTQEELEQIPFYRDHLRRIGLGWCAWTNISFPTGDTVEFCIERAGNNGPVPLAAIQKLDRLRPHLARASFLSMRASLSRARTSVMSLETVGLPAAILSDKGKLLASNSLFDQSILGAVMGNGDILRFKDKSTQTTFALLLAETVGGVQSAQLASFILRDNAESRPNIAHIFPLNTHERDVFTGASALFYVTTLGGQATMPGELLQSLFDLTPAEANIAKLIGEGKTISNVSVGLSIQESTVRVHLKSIFSKTGVKRQSDLVRLVMLPSLRPSDNLEAFKRTS